MNIREELREQGWIVVERWPSSQDCELWYQVERKVAIFLVGDSKLYLVSRSYRLEDFNPSILSELSGK